MKPTRPQPSTYAREEWDALFESTREHAVQARNLSAEANTRLRDAHQVYRTTRDSATPLMRRLQRELDHFMRAVPGTTRLSLAVKRVHPWDILRWVLELVVFAIICLVALCIPAVWIAWLWMGVKISQGVLQMFGPEGWYIVLPGWFLVLWAKFRQ